MRYTYGFRVQGAESSTEQSGARDTVREASDAAERAASHMVKTYPELSALCVVLTRWCAECGGTGAVKRKSRNVFGTRPCPECRGLVGAQFILSRVLTPDASLLPCEGACCDGVERVVCGGCGYPHPAAEKCTNPACARSRAA